MFYTKKDNNNHIYATRWFIDGKTIFVTVDDFVPGSNGRSSFAKARDN
jgi:hypothetical protein